MEFTPEKAPTNDGVDEIATIDLKKYFFLLWDNLWLILLVMILAAGAANILSIRMTPVYEATTTLLIDVPAYYSTEISAIYAAEEKTSTYSKILTKSSVLTETIKRLGMIISTSQLEEMITVEPQTDAQLIDITVASTDPEAASAIANTLVEVFTQDIIQLQLGRYQSSLNNLQTQMSEVEELIVSINTQLESVNGEDELNWLKSELAEYQGIYAELLSSYENVRLSEAQSLTSIILIEPALTPEIPSRPRTLVNSALAAIISLGLSVVAIFAANVFDDRLKDPDKIAQQLGLPVLGVINPHNSKKNNEIIVATHPRNPISEQYRTLRTNVNFALVDKELRSLLVASSELGDGKTTIASNLAMVFAQSGRNTYLIDCDMRKPTIHARFDLNNRFGLSTLFHHDGSSFQRNDLWEQPYECLSVLTSGALPPNPSELLASHSMKKILESLKAKAEMLIIDSPPVMAVTDAVVLAPLVDGVLIVVEPGKTKLKEAKIMLRQFKRANAKVLGVAIKFAKGKLDKRYSRRYGYGSYSKFASYYQCGSEEISNEVISERKDLPNT